MLTLGVAGQFVLVMPRAYHSGFCHGLNCSEMVSFGTADWLPWGAQAASSYRQIPRRPSFSHEELVCRVVQEGCSADVAQMRLGSRLATREVVEAGCLVRPLHFEIAACRTSKASRRIGGGSGSTFAPPMPRKGIPATAY